MKKTIDEYEFRRAFETIRPDSFSYDGLGVLFSYLEEYEESTGEEIELDVIAICCDFSEYESREEIAEMYDIEPDEIEKYTSVIEFDGGVIIQNW